MDVYSSAQFAQNSMNALSHTITNYGNQKHAEKMQKNDYNYNEMAADNADIRTRNLYNDLYSPKAQMQQLKEAGLSPSIFASGGIAGKSGQSGAQGGGVSGKPIAAQAPLFTTDITQMALLNAEKEKIEAETENIKSNTKNTEKDTELKGQEIINLIADTKNKAAENRLITANADLAECNVVESEMTLQTRIEKAYHNTAKAAAEVRSAVVKADLDEATFDAAYQLAYANLDNTLTNTEYLESEIKVNKAQIKEIAERIRNSQWETWATEKEQNRRDAIFEFDKAKLQTEVKQWAAEQNIKLAIAKIEMISDLVGYVCNFATSAMSNVTELKKTKAYTDAKKEIANKPKTTSKMSYRNVDGTINTVTHTK